MKALLIIDVQNDFMAGGALPGFMGEAVIPVINGLMDRFPRVLAARDWHESETVHFERWPVHCVRFTHGAEFHPDLHTEKFDAVFLKGTDPNYDSGYTAFEATNEDFEKHLREHDVDELYVCGLNTEYSVKGTVLDALNRGFKTYVIIDAVAPMVAAHARPALDEMQRHGATLIQSGDIALV